MTVTKKIARTGAYIKPVFKQEGGVHFICVPFPLGKWTVKMKQLLLISCEAKRRAFLLQFDTALLRYHHPGSDHSPPWKALAASIWKLTEKTNVFRTRLLVEVYPTAWLRCFLGEILVEWLFSETLHFGRCWFCTKLPLKPSKKHPCQHHNCPQK